MAVRSKVSRVVSGAISVALAVVSGAADAALPADVPVKTPAGEVVQIAVPAQMCGYPVQMRNALAGFLASGDPKLDLLGAAGDCATLKQRLQGQTATVTPTIELAMLDSQANPARRMSPVQYRAFCLNHYPPSGANVLSSTIEHGLQQLDHGLTLSGEVSLGVLAETPDAIFGGVMTVTANGPEGMRVVEVESCFAPHGVPILWTFAETFDRSTPPSEISRRLKSTLALAEDRTAATIRLNSGH